ncbi:MAG: hypothetical protein JW888_17410 [Pirellulales bacterium]|nr:hypothetical protein [Pirellulales bacterium]
MRRIAFAVLALWMASSAVLAESSDAGRPDAASANVAEKKQTALGLYLRAPEAYQRWRAEPLKTVVLDVRTPAEYVFIGHAPMAYNVPFAFWKSDVFPKDGMPVMKPNPDFLARVKRIASPDETLLVMCRSGERGAKACNALAKAGYTKVYHVVDGFEGDEVEDPESAFNGKRMKNGWRNAGLPWTYKLSRNQMYLPVEK